jgi:carbonic anhydrase/acetyltransferase-like protein (isoleucine patch superfamily)
VIEQRRGRFPEVHRDAYVASTAVVAGDVTIGAGTALLDGAVVVAESAPVRIGRETVIMEHAVIRGAGKHAAKVGDRTMVGPGCHISGAEIGDECMIATHATVFNGCRLDDGVLVAVGAIVHVSTYLPEGSRVPMQHIAVGDPVQIFPPDRAPDAHRAVERLGFTKSVFDHDTSDLTFRQSMAWLCTTYSAALRRHGSAPPGAT